ncbi:MAG: cysteine desulfurase [candidate division NC10 bacterium]|nr:cysteine desulfurase [candidate division NC10 bacterium]MDE2322558.1 cysteine desulfurase [candidate division NC10 bacterium]
MAFDVERIREDFPVLRQQIRGRPLVYLDNAATSQKPKIVVETMEQYYLAENSNVHRGVHLLSERATEAFEGARRKVARFLNARDAREIVFVRGATEGINLVAHSFARPRLTAGDEILISEMEHHSNIVPWQIVCQETGALLRVVPINDDGELRLDEYERLLGARTRLVSIVHVSNALGTVNPVKQVIKMAHERGVPVLIDGAQAAPHLPVDVQAMDCDFYVCSGHKLFGPTGIGIVFGKARHFEAMPPYQGGGDMILSVTFEKTIYNEAPLKFEAGTPHIAGAIGLGAAIDYVSGIGLDQIAAYEHELLAYATDATSAIPGLRIIGTAKEKASILSFVLDGVHAHDIGTILDQEGVAIRTGHHCAQPVLQRFGVPATARASVAFYNTRDEIDALVKAIYKVTELFG